MLCLLLLLSSVAFAADFPVSLEGQWEAVPLAKTGTKTPDGSGEFAEFRETYATESFVVFYGRLAAPRAKDVGIFSWKDGKLSTISLDGPDGRKMSIYPDRIFAGKRLVYFSSVMPDHLYGWDGEKMTCVACAGQELEYRGVKHTLKRAWVLDVSPGGNVLVYWDAPKQNANGWATHDGNTLKAVWKEGDELPGMSGVQTKNLSSGRGCYMGCVPTPKLLDDGSIVGVIEVTGAPYKKALFRVAAERAEALLAEKEAPLPKGFRPEMNDLLGASPDSFVMDATSISFSYGASTIMYSKELRLLFGDKGRYSLETAAGLSELGTAESGKGFWSESEAAFDRALMPVPSGPQAVVSILVRNGRQNWKQRFSGKVTLRDFPGLYYWNGKKLLRIAWEESLGLTLGQAAELLERKNVRPTAEATRDRNIDLRLMAKPAAGTAVRLPIEVTRESWMIPVESIDGKLVRPPKFEVEGLNANLADVLVWRNANEAVVRVPDGLFLLRRK
jgi:hypothetical protein